MTKRKPLHIGLSLAPTWLSGDAWRRPGSNIDGLYSSDFALDLARRAEAAHLDFVFRPDVSFLPMEVLETVYQFANLSFSEKARVDAQQWIASNSREKRAGHDYRLETFGLSEQQMQDDYAPYRARHLQHTSQ